MSDLETFAAHARAMSTARHVPDCPVKGQYARFSEDGRTSCTGCVTDADRALWARLADEVAAYLHTDEQEALL